MNNLSLNNGKIITVGNMQDILEYIREDYSEDIAKELEDVEIDIQEDIEDIKNSMSDMMDIIVNLQNYIVDGNRLNRDTINKDLTEVRIMLREYI